MFAFLSSQGIFAQNQEAINADKRERARIESARRESDKQNAYNNRPFEKNAGSATGILGKVGHYNEKTPEQSAQSAAIQQRLEVERAKLTAEAKLYQNAFAPYQQYYISTGAVLEDEARAMATRTVTSLAGPDHNKIALHEDAAFFMNVADSHLEFNKLAATADFDKLVGVALNFCILSAKSIKALQGLIVRFPDKQTEIDMAIISCMQGTFGSKVIKIRPCYDCQTFEEHKMVNAMFFTMAQKYPQELAEVVDAEYTFDAYKQSIDWARSDGRKGRKELARLQQEYQKLPMKTDREFWLNDQK